ncbi:MAG: ABC-2 transporter permease, partial [Acidobacteriota bacterium]
FVTVLDSSPERQGNVQGFIVGVVSTCTLIFTLNVVSNERKRRHFVFLKSLPVEDRDVVQAKFVAVALLSGTLGNLPFLLLLLVGSPPTFAQWLLVNGVLLFYSSLVLYFSIRFQSIAALFVPLYLLIGLFFLAGGFRVEIEEYLLAILNNPLFFLTLAGCAALLFLLLSIRAFRLKELDF